MDRRTLIKAGLATSGGLLVPATGAAFARASARPRLGKVLARNMRTPWGIAFLPGGHALVSERDSGRVYKVFRRGGRRFVGRVPGVYSQKQNGGEGGLLGLAVGPHFRRTRWVYAYMSTRSDNRIVRMRYVRGRLRRPHLVLSGIPTGLHHNGGRLAFGPGGMLYASTGDAGDSRRSQNRRSLGGKVLRMTPGGKVPRGNPFGNYTWSYGHRNVEGLAFDRRGRLWASELGENRVDELNRIRRGRNYGWPYVEGHDGRGRGFRDPFTTWPTYRASPSGVAVVRGKAFLGALRGEALLGVRLNGRHRRRHSRYFAGDLGRIRTVQRAPDGSLWLTTSNHDGRGDPGRNDDRIIRVRLR